MSQKVRKSLDGIIRLDQEHLLELEKLLAMQCTDVEVAAWFNIHRGTLIAMKKRDVLFAERYKRGKDRGKASLRRLMWQSANGADGREPNVAMQIFLAKNILGMSDKQELTGKDKEPITFRVVTDA